MYGSEAQLQKACTWSSEEEEDTWSSEEEEIKKKL